MESNANLKKLHEYVEQIKASEEIGVKYMQKWEEIAYEREDAREEGREEGLAIGKKAAELVFLRRLLQNKHRDEETVAEDLDLPLEYVHKVNELLKAYPTESDEEIAARMIE